MTVKVRFAPSPTGRIHAGNIRTALLNWMFARRKHGSLLFRLDDTDTERSTEEFAAGIREDLTWLGLDWADEVKQSDRFARYDEAVEKLKASGRLYPAYETPDELELKRKRQLARGRPPVYDRAALKLTEADRAKLEAEGRRPHWRFMLETRDVAWADLIRGEQHVDAASLSDPVLVREDGTYLYTLPSVVDDIDLGITHVIRGEDHVVNTAPQIQLFEALGAHTAGFRPSQPAGRRRGSGAVQARPVAVDRRVCARRGSSRSPLRAIRRPSAPPIPSPRMRASTSLRRISLSTNCHGRRRASIRTSSARSTPSFCICCHSRPSAERLTAMGVGGGEAFWLAVRCNLAVLADAKFWWQVS